MKHFFLLAAWLLTAATASAQLAVTVSQVKTAGSKAVVPLVMKNGLTQKVESARAAVFLLDDQGKMVAQGTRWVIGGTSTNHLAAGATNTFHFVVQASKPFTTTNLTAKVTVNRVVLEGGKLADPVKELVIQPATK